MRGLSGVAETAYIWTGFESHREMPLSKSIGWYIYDVCISPYVIFPLKKSRY